MRRIALLSAVAGVWLLLGAPALATASVGVASDLGRITLDAPVHPGQRVTLPAITISNSGTEPTVYRMFALPDSGAAPADATWFSFDPEVLTLAPGVKQRVVAVMAVPADLPAGEYRVILVARPIAGGGQYNIAAGPRMRIQVSPASWIATRWYALAGWMERMAPWSYVGSAVLALLAASAVVVPIRRARSRRRAAAKAPMTDAGETS
jgi:hypothetical protein